jgi:hypothetical protein
MADFVACVNLRDRADEKVWDSTRLGTSAILKLFYKTSLLPPEQDFLPQNTILNFLHIRKWFYAALLLYLQPVLSVLHKIYAWKSRTTLERTLAPFVKKNGQVTLGRRISRYYTNSLSQTDALRLK